MGPHPDENLLVGQARQVRRIANTTRLFERTGEGGVAPKAATAVLELPGDRHPGLAGRRPDAPGPTGRPCSGPLPVVVGPGTNLLDGQPWEQVQMTNTATLV